MDIDWSILKFLSAQIGYAVRKTKRVHRFNSSWRLRNVIAIADYLLANLGALLRGGDDIGVLSEHVFIPVMVPASIADRVAAEVSAFHQCQQMCSASNNAVWPDLPISGIECSDLEKKLFNNFVVKNGFLCEREDTTDKPRRAHSAPPSPIIEGSLDFEKTHVSTDPLTGAIDLVGAWRPLPPCHASLVYECCSELGGRFASRMNAISLSLESLTQIVGELNVPAVYDSLPLQLGSCQHVFEVGTERLIPECPCLDLSAFSATFQEVESCIYAVDAAFASLAGAFDLFPGSQAMTDSSMIAEGLCEVSSVPFDEGEGSVDLVNMLPAYKTKCLDVFVKLDGLIRAACHACRVDSPEQIGIEMAAVASAAIEEKHEDNENGMSDGDSDVLETVMASRAQERDSIQRLILGETVVLVYEGELSFGEWFINCSTIVDEESAERILLDSFPELNGHDIRYECQKKKKLLVSFWFQLAPVFL